MIKVDIGGLQTLQFAIQDVVAYETDNSCGDPECCGGPYGCREAYEEGLVVLRSHGIEYHPEK